MPTIADMEWGVPETLASTVGEVRTGASPPDVTETVEAAPVCELAVVGDVPTLVGLTLVGLTLVGLPTTWTSELRCTAPRSQRETLRADPS